MRSKGQLDKPITGKYVRVRDSTILQLFFSTTSLYHEGNRLSPFAVLTAVAMQRASHLHLCLIRVRIKQGLCRLALVGGNAEHECRVRNLMVVKARTLGHNGNRRGAEARRRIPTHLGPLLTLFLPPSFPTLSYVFQRKSCSGLRSCRKSRFFFISEANTVGKTGLHFRNPKKIQNRKTE